jgi:hypothetical protein
MDIDLTKAQPGDRVRFVFGGHAVIKTVSVDDDLVSILYENDTHVRQYHFDGQPFDSSIPLWGIYSFEKPRVAA